MYRPSPIGPPMTNGRSTPGRPGDRADDLRAPSDLDLGTSTFPPIELGPIIKAKIQPPALRATTLTRQRLLDRLTEATSHRLTLLIAEAGYGKTTLLAEFASQADVRTMWYRLDRSDA